MASEPKLAFAVVILFTFFFNFFLIFFNFLLLATSKSYSKSNILLLSCCISVCACKRLWQVVACRWRRGRLQRTEKGRGSRGRRRKRETPARKRGKTDNDNGKQCDRGRTTRRKPQMHFAYIHIILLMRFTKMIWRCTCMFVLRALAFGF